jgi:folylpolyglutamate synthase/dihydropteroate synthase
MTVSPQEARVNLRYTVPMASSAQPNVTVASLQQEARALAICLAQMLAASSMPEEQKAAWAALIPEMRLDQLSRFAVVLDGAVAQAARAELADTVQKFRVVLEKYAAIQSQTDNDFMKGIAGLVDDLRKAERVTT